MCGLWSDGIVDVGSLRVLLVRRVPQNRAGVSLLRERLLLEFVRFLFLYSAHCNYGRLFHNLFERRSTLASLPRQSVLAPFIFISVSFRFIQSKCVFVCRKQRK